VSLGGRARTGGAIAVEVLTDPHAVADAVATLIADVVEHALDDGRGAVLGCPAGRTPRLTYARFGEVARDRGLDLSTLQVVMMDEYVVDHADGFRRCPADAHHSCRGTAEIDLRRTVNDQLPAAHHIPAAAVHVPDPADPGRYDALVDDLGGVDLFVLASGASDGHVAFNPPGSSIDSGTRIVRLADATRHDNLSTFPAFGSIDEVPHHGVTIGLGTIASGSRRVVLILTGTEKHESYRRVVGSDTFDPAWPATIVHACRDALVVADRDAADGLSH
jgi:glucosamine-6-phosphate deaminase